MLRYLRLLFVALTALILLFLALSNRDPVTVRLLPQDLSMMLNTEGAWTMPLFLIIFGAIAAGVLIGFVWEWFREMRLRGDAKQKTREVARLEREIAVLKDANSIPPQDEVLAILDQGAPAVNGVRVKICGLKTPADVAAAAAAGAHYIGLNFFAKSPRSVDPQTARALALAAPEGMCKVSLTVDADDATLDAITAAVPLDMLQLHGHETPARVAEVRARYGLPVMKAVGVATEADLPQLLDYSLVADQILVDAKAPKGAVLPGGNGLPFDWRLVAQRRWLRPWMLAGGLTPDNVAEAVRLTNARQVDVASGVESAPGVKDPARMTAFVRAATAMAAPGFPRLR